MDTISLVFILGYALSICISADTNNIEASCNVSSLGSKTALVCSHKVKFNESAPAENLTCSNSTIKNVTNIYIGIKIGGGCINSANRSSGHDVKCCQLENKTDILLNAKCLQELQNNTEKYNNLLESARKCKGLETCKINDTILHVPARNNSRGRLYSSYIVMEYSCSSELENKENNSNANENLSTHTNNQLTTTTRTTDSIPQTDVEPSTSRTEDTKTSLGTENKDISLDKRKQNKGDFQTRTVVIAATVGTVVLGILMTVLACLRIRRKEATKVTSEKDTSKTSDNLTRRNLDNIEQGVEETPLKSDEDHIYDQADETTGRITASTTGGQTKDHQMEQNEDTYDHTDLSRRKSAPIRTERAQSEETNPYDLTESAAAVAKIRMSVTDNTYDHTRTDNTYDHTGTDNTYDRTGTDNTYDRTGTDNTYDRTGTDNTYDHTGTDSTYDRT